MKTKYKPTFCDVCSMTIFFEQVRAVATDTTGNIKHLCPHCGSSITFKEVK